MHTSIMSRTEYRRAIRRDIHLARVARSAGCAMWYRDQVLMIRARWQDR
jgi:hypothetical protein